MSDLVGNPEVKFTCDGVPLTAVSKCTRQGCNIVSPKLGLVKMLYIFRALQEADVVLLLGARLNWILHFGAPPRFRPNVKIIQVGFFAMGRDTVKSLWLGIQNVCCNHHKMSLVMRKPVFGVSDQV